MSSQLVTKLWFGPRRRRRETAEVTRLVTRRCSLLFPVAQLQSSRRVEEEAREKDHAEVTRRVTRRVHPNYGQSPSDKALGCWTSNNMKPKRKSKQK
jgi:hypothetical protein